MDHQITPALADTSHLPPIVFQTNCGYVKIKNRGTKIATNIVVSGYHCRPSAGLTWPDDWKPMDTPESLTLPNLAPGDIDIAGPFLWTPSELGHECMLFWRYRAWRSVKSRSCLRSFMHQGTNAPFPRSRSIRCLSLAEPALLAWSMQCEGYISGSIIPTIERCKQLSTFTYRHSCSTRLGVYFRRCRLGYFQSRPSRQSGSQNPRPRRVILQPSGYCV